MTRREQLLENYEDALFALLMDEVAVTQGREEILENARLAQDESARVPEEADRRCLAAIARQFRSKRVKAVGRGTWAVMKKVPVLVMLATFLFATAFAASPEFRSTTLKAVMDLYPNELSVGFATPGGDTSHLNPAQMPLEVGWIPDGFVLQDEHIDPMAEYKTYYDSNGNFIDITLWLTDNAGVSVDTEDAAVEDITINGMDMKMITKPNEHHLVWVDTERAYILTILSYGTSREDIIKVAEKLTIR